MTETPSPFEIYLRPTPVMDYDTRIVGDFIRDNSRADVPATERVISLYYAVRDQIRYDPYVASERLSDFSASRTLEQKRGWCVTKSLLYAACCRAVGVPTRLGYADVRNHLSTENLRRRMGTDVFYWHGYTDVYLHGRWVKATPVFNIEMCDRFRVKPLDFDGREDSIFHAFDIDGRKHMEYLNFRGDYADLPLEEIQQAFETYYPKFGRPGETGDFEREVIRETPA
jgi:transglutaminase-like putative cysteine protease